jgi:hypothetical protein
MGSSGASSGQVGYPAYVETVHSNWLNQGVDAISDSMTDILNAALGASPYAGMVPYDPAGPLGNIDTEVTTFNNLINSIAATMDFDALEPDELTDVEINAEVTAYRNQADAELISVVLPRFQAGMRDIGAVHSSAFTLGQAILEDGQDRDVNKFAADLRLKAKASATERSDLMIKIASLRAEMESKVVQAVTEANKLRINAEKIELDQEYSFDVADAKWDLEVFQHGANLMAAPSGAGVNTQSLSGDPLTMLFGRMLMS